MKWGAGCVATAAAAFALSVSPAGAQVLPDAEAQRAAAVLAGRLASDYPLADVAARYAAALEAAVAAGRYRGLAACALADRLTADLQAVHPDRHLRVSCRAQREAEPPAAHALAAADYGVSEVQLWEALPVGYLRTTAGWTPSQANYETAAAAMSVLARAAYVILDVRGNPGGSGDFGNVLLSYLFPDGPHVDLVRGRFRDPARDTVEGTFPFVPGRRLDTAKVYVLVDAGTASAAEGFAFALQHAGRATIVGQTTAGAGIAGYGLDLPGGLQAFLPDKLIVAADGAPGWEGVGVKPDVATAPGKELEAVTALVLDDLAARGRIDRIGGLPADPAAARAPPAAAAANLAGCTRVQAAGEGVTAVNACGAPETLQVITSAMPRLVRQYPLAPGEGVRITPPPGEGKTGWRAIAVCPAGRFSDPPLRSAFRAAFAAGRYACSAAS